MKRLVLVEVEIDSDVHHRAEADLRRRRLPVLGDVERNDLGGVAAAIPHRQDLFAGADLTPAAALHPDRHWFGKRGPGHR